MANQAPDAASIGKQCGRDLAAVFDIGKRLGILCAGINQGQGVQLVRQGRHRGGRCAENHLEFSENVSHFLLKLLGKGTTLIKRHRHLLIGYHYWRAF